MGKFLSHKQELFRDYLIEKLGFLKDDFLNDYLLHLKSAVSKFKIYAAQDKVWCDQTEGYIPQHKNDFNTYKEYDKFFLPEKFDLIDFLQAELRLKKKDRHKYRVASKYISATDIANYTYCPVSYAISKTFEVEKLQQTMEGTYLHESHLLTTGYEGLKLNNYIDKDRKFGFIYRGEGFGGQDLEEFVNQQNEEFFQELRNSIVVYQGHRPQDNGKYFVSSKGKFIGQPDYIFKKEIDKSYFVVEEKFQLVPMDPTSFNINSKYTEKDIEAIRIKRHDKRFFDNHVNQLRSYIFGISECDVKVGYLIYWKYELNYGRTSIVSCNVLQINKDDINREKLIAVYTNLKELINKGEGNFDANARSSVKCANCVVNPFCGHKTGQFNTYTLPYDTKYMKTKYVPFPQELKK